MLIALCVTIIADNERMRATHMTLMVWTRRCAVFRAAQSLNAQFGILLATSVQNVALQNIVLDGARFDRLQSAPAKVLQLFQACVESAML